jgi:hypothetical protein
MISARAAGAWRYAAWRVPVATDFIELLLRECLARSATKFQQQLEQIPLPGAKGKVDRAVYPRLGSIAMTEE